MAISRLADRDAGLHPDREFDRSDIGNPPSHYHTGESAVSFAQSPATGCAHAAIAGLAQISGLFTFDAGCSYPAPNLAPRDIGAPLQHQERTE
jgi:hypothetical protein